MGLFDYRMEGTQPQGMLQDLIKRYKAGVTERVGLLKQDPVGYLSQAAMEGLPPMPDIGQNPDGSIRRNPDDPAIKWLADNVGFGALTVYHGSPHKFSKFDMSKIGTGEGRATEGHGLYFSSSPEVAKEYMDAMSYSRGMDGSITKADIPDDQIRNMLDWHNPLIEQSPEVQKKLGVITRDFDWEELMEKRATEQAAEMGVSLMETPAMKEIYKRIDDAYWHKTLTAGQYYRGLSDDLGGEKQVSEALKNMGIPGVRYLEPGPYNADNFAVFDDQLPRILERNGVPTGAQPWQPGEYELLRHAPK